MLLDVENLNVYYGAIHALQGISFSVDQGEIVTLIGANGAGKSTTLRTISGLLRPRRGAVRFRGEDITMTPAEQIVRLGVGHVPEGRMIFSNLTVDENLDFYGGVYQIGAALGGRIAWVLDNLGGEWIECKTDGSIRGCYPGPGYTYDRLNDVFVPPPAPPEDP